MGLNVSEHLEEEHRVKQNSVVSNASSALCFSVCAMLSGWL